MARKRSACAQCEGSKGQCGYNQTGQFVGCYCSGGQVIAQNCTTISSVGSTPPPPPPAAAAASPFGAVGDALARGDLPIRRREGIGGASPVRRRRELLPLREYAAAAASPPPLPRVRRAVGSPPPPLRLRRESAAAAAASFAQIQTPLPLRRSRMKGDGIRLQIRSGGDAREEEGDVSAVWAPVAGRRRTRGSARFSHSWWPQTL
ncbi:hypothetical protein ACP4OV_030278 [Aristida adscensionis]